MVKDHQTLIGFSMQKFDCNQRGVLILGDLLSPDINL